MTDLLIGYFELLVYDASVIIIAMFAVKHLIHYWHLQKAVGQTFVDKEMMNRQIEFQKRLMELQATSAPESVVQ